MLKKGDSAEMWLYGPGLLAQAVPVDAKLLEEAVAGCTFALTRL